ncbi:hypothetical protein NM688_g5092 [Phlebia brevispora]|uniref:Uncharacterized protein n=1 Tax=Phlebia brevispora TaxID=194682 RepID=A0ACC1T139_9APHY|nr:hypothetical protein NM688_g5092 [Phlebia brevispora]
MHRLLTEKEEWVDTVNELDIEKERLEAEVEEWKEKFSRLEDTLATHEEEKVQRRQSDTALKGQVERLNTELSKSRAQISSLLQEFRNLEVEKARLHSCNEVSSAEIATLQAANEKLRGELGASKTGAETLHAKFVALQGEHDALQQETAASKAQLESLQGEITLLKERLEETLAERSREVQQRESDAEMLDSALSECKKETEDARAQVIELAAAQARLSSENDRLRKDLDEAIQQSRTVQQRYDMLDGEHASVTHAVETLTADIERVTKEKEDLWTQWQNFFEERDRVQRSVQLLNAYKESLSESIRARPNGESASDMQEEPWMFRLAARRRVLQSTLVLPSRTRALNVQSVPFDSPSPAEIAPLLDEYATHSPRPLTLATLLSFGRPVTPESVLESVGYVLTEVPRLFGWRVRAFENLPFIVGLNPFIARILAAHRKSFKHLATYPSVKTLEENKMFTAQLEALVRAHTNDIPIMAKGFQECSKYLSPAEISTFLDAAIRNRIAVRLLAEQHIAISRDLETQGASEDHIGVVHMRCSPAEMIRMCASFVTELCEATLGSAPKIIIDGDVNATFAYVPVHIEYILTEILKNAFRASVERQRSSSSSSLTPRPVRITIAAPLPLSATSSSPPPTDAPIDANSNSHPTLLSLRIRDEGGGVSPAHVPHIFSYSFTTARRLSNINNYQYEDDEQGPYAAQSVGGIAGMYSTTGHVTRSADDSLDGRLGPSGGSSLFADLVSRGAAHGMGGTIAGLGYGLPLSRLYAMYFGGSLEFVSLDGWELLGRFQKPVAQLREQQKASDASDALLPKTIEVCMDMCGSAGMFPSIQFPIVDLRVMGGFLTGSMILYFALIAAAVSFVWGRFFNMKPPFPPGPPSDPILGHIRSFPRRGKTEKWYEWSKTYGDVMYFDLLGRPLVVLSSERAAVDLLEKRSVQYSDRPYSSPVHLLKWEGTLAFLPYGNAFYQQRKLFRDALAPQRCVAVREIQLRRVHKLLSNLHRNPEEVEHHIGRYAVSVVMEMTYGCGRVNADTDRYVALAKRVEEDLQAINDAAILDLFPLLRHLPHWLPGPSFIRYVFDTRRDHHEMKALPFEQLRQDISEGKARPSFTSTNLEQMIRTHTDTPENIELLRTASMHMWTTGSDTTWAAISTFILAMVIHPEVQRKAQDEIDRVIGSSRLPEFNDRDSLPYLECVLQECRRWHPSAPLAVPHRATEDDLYQGMFIPKGATIIANSRAITMDETVYRDPHEFCPERFLPERGEPYPTKSFFGYGRRVCPGRYLADASIWIAAANILAVYNIRKAKDEHGRDITPDAKFTEALISHPEPFRCDIHARNSHASTLINMTSAALDAE